MAVPGSLPKYPPSKLGYADLRRCHMEAYNFLSKALQLDESGRGDKAESLDMYSMGVTELEKGINMHITAEGDEALKVERLKNKMTTNLDMARERVSNLCTLMGMYRVSGGELRGNIGEKAPKAPTPTESLRLISVTPREPLKHKKVQKQIH